MGCLKTVLNRLLNTMFTLHFTSSFKLLCRCPRSPDTSALQDNSLPLSSLPRVRNIALTTVLLSESWVILILKTSYDLIHWLHIVDFECMPRHLSTRLFRVKDLTLLWDTQMFPNDFLWYPGLARLSQLILAELNKNVSII